MRDSAPFGRILVVDDEPCIRDLLEALLCRCGYMVKTALDGQAALEMWDYLDACELVITDNCMPRLSGGGLVHQLREGGYGGKVIVYSASLSADDMQRFGLLQVDAIVQKGGPAQELLVEVTRAMARRNTVEVAGV